MAMAAAASPSTSKWRIENPPSQIDIDARSVTAVLDSTNMLRAMASALEAATLLIAKCEDGELSVYVAWPPDMGDEDRQCGWKFDADAPPRKRHGQGRCWGTATFAPAPYEFAAWLPP